MDSQNQYILEDFDEQVEVLGSTPVCIHWFRRDLRLRFNEILFEAVRNANSLPMMFIYIFETDLRGKIADHITSMTQWNFIKNCVIDMNKKLDGNIMLLKGDPIEIFEELFTHRDFYVNTLSFESNPDTHKKETDWRLRKLCIKYNVTILETEGFTIYPFYNLAKFLEPGSDFDFEDISQKIVNIPISKPRNISLLWYKNHINFFDHLKINLRSRILDMNKDFPSRQIDKTVNSAFIPGEDEGLARFMVYRFLNKSNKKGSAKNNKKISDNLMSLSIISPYVSNGCLNIHFVFYKMMGIVKNRSIITHPLINREYQHLISMLFPTIFANEFTLPNRYAGIRKIASETISRYFMGLTGVPYIDSVLRQLLVEGFSSSSDRDLVVRFTIGPVLNMSWEFGSKFMASTVIDLDEVVCYYNWGFYIINNRHKELECKIPLNRQKFIKRMIPELRNMPEEYLNKPWECPVDTQKLHGCIIGKHYPYPMAELKLLEKFCFPSTHNGNSPGVTSDETRQIEGLPQDRREISHLYGN
ncbi:MAG: Cryptochrome-1 [Marteilia pararefringens]